MREDLYRQMTGVHSSDAPGTDILQLIERTRRVALHYTSGDHLCFERRRDNVLFEGNQALWEIAWFELEAGGGMLFVPMAKTTSVLRCRARMLGRHETGLSGQDTPRVLTQGFTPYHAAEPYLLFRVRGE